MTLLASLRDWLRRNNWMQCFSPHGRTNSRIWGSPPDQAMWLLAVKVRTFW